MKTIYESVSFTKEEMIETYKEFINQPEQHTTEEINLWKTFVKELEVISTDEEFSNWIESKKGWRNSLEISK
jgi:hypothetical protein